MTPSIQSLFGMWGVGSDGLFFPVGNRKMVANVQVLQLYAAFEAYEIQNTRDRKLGLLKLDTIRRLILVSWLQLRTRIVE